MYFNINNTNFQCAPMHNQNNNNKVMGYLCSTKNVEGFFQLNDTTKLNDVKNKDSEGQFYGYLGGVKIISAVVEGDLSRTLILNFEDKNGATNSTKLNKLTQELGVNNSLPFIFHFNNQGAFYVFRTTNASINGNTLTLKTGVNMINNEDFDKFKKLTTLLELRVGVYDINNRSQRDSVRTIWERS